MSPDDVPPSSLWLVRSYRAHDTCWQYGDRIGVYGVQVSGADMLQADGLDFAHSMVEITPGNMLLVSHVVADMSGRIFAEVLSPVRCCIALSYFSPEQDRLVRIS